MEFQISSAHSMDARKCVHAQKPFQYPVRHSRMNQARSDEEEKETGKTEARRLIEGKAAQQNRIWGTKTRPACTAEANNAGGGTSNFP